MSRRRQTYVPYQPITDDDLYDVHFGTQTRRDRLHLTLIPTPSDDLAFAPPAWLGITLALVLGVLLMPAIWLGAWLINWLSRGPL